MRNRLFATFIVLFALTQLMPCRAQRINLPTTELLLHAVYTFKESKSGSQQSFYDDKYIHINGCTKTIEMIFAQTGEIYESFRYYTFQYYPPFSNNNQGWVLNVVNDNPRSTLERVELFLGEEGSAFYMIFKEGKVTYIIEDPKIWNCY